MTSATEALLSAAALGGSWERGLDDLARAAGSHSACVWSSRAGRPAYVGNATFCEQGAAKINRPGDAPYTEDIFLRTRIVGGFVSADTHPDGGRIGRLPFYVDVLSPLGFSHFSGMSLDPGDGSLLKVAFWRSRSEGAFDHGQVATLNAIAKDVGAAVTFARRRGELIASERSSRYARSGDPTFLLGHGGEATPANAEAADLPANSPLGLCRDRLVASFDDETRRLERVVGEAVRRDGHAGSVILTDAGGRRHQLLVLPLKGEALDVFCATRAIATLVRIGVGPRARPHDDAATFLASGFDLTGREIGVALLIAQGVPPAGIAQHLGIGEGTARNHVKAVLRKVGVHGQVELAALVARYR